MRSSSVKKLIIFDMDGTLVNSSLTIAKAINYERENLGFQPMVEVEILKRVNDPDIDPAQYFYHAKAFDTDHEKGGPNFPNGMVLREPQCTVCHDQADVILDIGPETMKIYTKYIKKAETLIWNGPMGMFENEKYKHGTLFIGRSIASRARGKAFGLIGGGETVQALRMTKMFSYVDWVSTGGGAILTYLSGDKLPGLTKIVK